MAETVRSRARTAFRAELAQAILDVFIARGFDEVTAEEAASAAGISRATFFRYFGSKEEVVLTAVDADVYDYARAVRAAESDLPAWRLARCAIEPVVSAVEAEPRRYRDRHRLITTQTSLRGRFTDHRRRAAAELAAALGERIADARTAEVIAATTMAVLDIAWRDWAAVDDGSFRQIADRLFDRLASL